MALAAALVAELFVVSGVSPFAVVRSLTVAVLVATALTVACSLALADRDRGGVAASLGILLLFGGADLRIMLVVGIGLAIMALERLATRRHEVIRWRVVGRVLTTLVAILALAIGIRAFQDGTAGVVARAVMAKPPGAVAVTRQLVTPDRPDIYLILLDGFARRDVLEDVFHADGGALVAGLADREFTVSSHSRATYARTDLTLTSMFNMRPLQEIDALEPLQDANSSASSGALMTRALNEATSLDVLRSLGYDIVSISSGYEGVAIRNVDTFIDTGQVNDFESVLLRRSLLSVVLRAFAPDFVSSQHRARIDGTMRALEEIAADSSARPRFVFSHIPSPHVPWVYNGDGTPRTAVEYESFHDDVPIPPGLTWARVQELYVGQVTWLGKEVLATVDQLVATSAVPPVIILFSDHGTWTGTQDGDFGPRFRTLLAARAPGRSQLFPDEVATVDLFPILFEGLFGLDLPQHPDTPSYMNSENSFDFHEVADPH